MAKYTFDKATGTLKEVAENDALAQVKKEENVGGEVVDGTGCTNIVESAEKPNVEDPNEPEVVFKMRSDHSLYQVEDTATGKWLCYFAGYALDIRFNDDEFKGVNATKKIEACLSGLTSLFRYLIYQQVLGDKLNPEAGNVKSDK